MDDSKLLFYHSSSVGSLAATAFREDQNICFGFSRVRNGAEHTFRAYGTLPPELDDLSRALHILKHSPDTADWQDNPACARFTWSFIQGNFLSGLKSERRLCLTFYSEIGLSSFHLEKPNLLPLLKQSMPEGCEYVEHPGAVLAYNKDEEPIIGYICSRNPYMAFVSKVDLTRIPLPRKEIMAATYLQVPPATDCMECQSPACVQLFTRLTWQIKPNLQMCCPLKAKFVDDTDVYSVEAWACEK